MPLLTYTELMLPLLVFAGAALQLAGGMGFGVVVGPTLVATIGATSGIQAAIILNIGVAMFGWLAGRKTVRYDILRPMAPGLILGVLGGVTATIFMPEWLVKASLCISLACICFMPESSAQTTSTGLTKLSLASGTMGGALAIPGPAAAVYLRSVLPSTKEMRSSMMPLLTLAYLFTGLVLLFTQGIAQSALSVSVVTMPAAAAGICAGIFAAKRVPEKTLKRLTQIILLATLASLSVTTVRDISAFF